MCTNMVICLPTPLPGYSCLHNDSYISVNGELASSNQPGLGPSPDIQYSNTLGVVTGRLRPPRERQTQAIVWRQIELGDRWGEGAYCSQGIQTVALTWLVEVYFSYDLVSAENPLKAFMFDLKCSNHKNK